MPPIFPFQELKKTAIDHGFNNTIVATFEDLPFMKQLEIIRCSAAFIGELQSSTAPKKSGFMRQLW